MPSTPTISDDMLAHSQALTQILADDISAQGPITFEQYMQTCLYHPQYGYYRSRNLPMGEQGDFITAPEISPLFSHCIAKQAMQVLNTIKKRPFKNVGSGSERLLTEVDRLDSKHDASEMPKSSESDIKPNASVNKHSVLENAILEIGAGSGKMAADILTYLKQNDELPSYYAILEPSANLRQSQLALLTQHHPDLLTSSQCQIIWLDALPTSISGIIVANEVLDAMPVQLVQYQDNWHSLGVDYQNEKLCWQAQTAEPKLLDQIEQLQIPSIPGYTTEINRQGNAWIKSLSDCLTQGMILLIDYGMPRQTYYHPQRSTGTLRCHLQHHVHNDPLLYPGCQDITAHVDFTSIAETGLQSDLDLLGYTHQAGFLLSLGIHEMLGQKISADEQLTFSQQIKQLTLPSGMGEQFKVIALGRGMETPLQGFKLIDQRDKLFQENHDHLQ